LSIAVHEAYFHCGKALMRSKLWSQETRIERAVLPSISQVIHDQTKLGEPEARPKSRRATRRSCERFKNAIETFSPSCPA